MLPLLPVLQVLYKDLDETGYAALLDDMLPLGYRMIAVYDGNKCVGISGVWIFTRFYSGRYIDMDNVVVLPEYRSKGVGQIMVDWLIEEGEKQNCQYAMLDAYVENFGAQRFYARNGFVPRGYHYIRPFGNAEVPNAPKSYG